MLAFLSLLKPLDNTSKIGLFLTRRTTDVCLYFCPNNTDDIKLQKTGVEEECEELFVGDRNNSIKVRVLCTKHIGDSLEQNKNVSEISEIQEGQELKNVQ